MTPACPTFRVPRARRPACGTGCTGWYAKGGACRGRARGTARGVVLTPLPAGAMCEQEATRRECAPFAPSHLLANRSATGEAKGVQIRCPHAPPFPSSRAPCAPSPGFRLPPFTWGACNREEFTPAPLHLGCANPHPHALPFAQAGGHSDSAPCPPARTPLRGLCHPSPRVCARGSPSSAEAAPPSPLLRVPSAKKNTVSVYESSWTQQVLPQM